MERTELGEDFSILFQNLNIYEEQVTATIDNDQSPVVAVFQSFGFLLNDLINQNKQLREEINQLKEQNQLQSERNAAFQLAINQLNEKNVEQRTKISRLNADDQNRNAQLIELNQRQNLLEWNVKSIRKYLPDECSIILPCVSHDRNLDTKWKQNAVTIAGGHGRGNRLDQLFHPYGISMDYDQTIYIADSRNHRVVEWKSNATEGITCGNELQNPSDVIIDHQTNSLIIADSKKRQVMRWSRQNLIEEEILISDINCFHLIMDKNGSLYVSDWVKHEVRRWRRDETGEGTIVAGGNGKGDQLNQLHSPTYLSVDEDESLYVTDQNNHRVMKWLKDAQEGIVIAGGNSQGNSLNQLSRPTGVSVDRLGQIYVADFDNHRVMRWSKGAAEGTVVVGGNGKGEQANQFNGPGSLFFDPKENLYVADYENDRIQKFEID